MVQIIIIKKEGTLTYDKIADISELYKKCGFRKAEGLEKINEWKIEDDNVELWGKASGKVIVKNQYIFSVPIDKKIYGNCSLMRKSGDKYIDMDEEIWNKIKNTKVQEKQDIQDNVKLEVIKNIMDTIKSDIDLMVKENSQTIINKKNIDEEELDVSDSASDSSNDSANSELKEETYLYSEEEEEEKK